MSTVKAQGATHTALDFQSLANVFSGELKATTKQVLNLLASGTALYIVGVQFSGKTDRDVTDAIKAACKSVGLGDKSAQVYYTTALAVARTVMQRYGTEGGVCGAIRACGKGQERKAVKLIADYFGTVNVTGIDSARTFGGLGKTNSGGGKSRAENVTAAVTNMLKSDKVADADKSTMVKSVMAALPEPLSLLDSLIGRMNGDMIDKAIKRLERARADLDKALASKPKATKAAALAAAHNAKAGAPTVNGQTAAQ